MPNVLVRNLPAEVHSTLLQRADAAGLSLQQYLSMELTRMASTPTTSEVLARIQSRSGGRVGLAQAVADLDDERE